MSFRYPALVFSLSFFFTACGHRESGPPRRYAVVGFENLSGDSSLDWAGRGAAEFLSRSLQGAIDGSVLSQEAVARAGQSLGSHPAGAPGISASRAGALVAGANHIVSGYIERTPAGIRIAATDEDAASHRTARTLSVTASSAFDAMDRLAHLFSDKAGPPPTGNAEAFRLYSTALGNAAAGGVPLLERAVTLDPSFGRAWVALARVVALSDRAAAAAVIARARERKLAPVDLAWLDFESAALDGDRTGTLAAMRRLSGFDAGDTGLARSLAEAETSAGNFSQAAAVWKRLTVSNPGDVNAWNQLGYTLCWSGDYTGALAALREYARLHPGDPNPLDSQGDVHYWFGKFSEAAASYAAAYAKMPGFLNGGELYKGAWARFLGGDKTGADALFAKFREARDKAGDPNIGILAGDWLYRTGREKEASALLRAALKNAPEKKDAAAAEPAVRAGTAAQLAVWDLLDGDRSAAAKDIGEGGGSNLAPVDVLVWIAAMPSATVSEWEARTARILAAPQLAGLRPIALGYSLMLDGQKQAALPVWEEVVKQSPGSDFFPRAILMRLKGQPVEHLSPPDSVSLNRFAAVLGKL